MSPAPRALAAVRALPKAAATVARNRILQPLAWRPLSPRMATWIVTHRCNARCVMCGIWRGEEGRDLTAGEIDRVLSDGLFRRLRFFGINGGEPLLRDDLVEVAKSVLSRCPSLERVSLATNGTLPERVGSILEPLAGACAERGVGLSVSVSVHAVGEPLARIYGVDEAFARISESLDALEGLKRRGLISLALNAVLLRQNLHRARELLAWAAERGHPVGFALGESRERFRNDGMDEALIGPGERPGLIGLLRRLEDDLPPLDPRGVRYGELVRIISGGRRTLSCQYAFGGVMVGHDGTLFYCPHSKGLGCACQRPAAEIFRDPANLDYRRRELLERKCPGCPPYTFTRLEMENEMFRLLARSILRSFRRHGVRS